MADSTERMLTKRIWLFLRHQGGVWTGGAIRSALSMTAKEVHPTISDMVKRGLVKRHEPKEWGKDLGYEVDDDCRIPDKLTLGEILNDPATQLKEAA